MSTAERQLTLSPDLQHVTRARHFVRDTLLEWGFPELADDAQLGTSELVANSIRHARTDVVVTVRRTDEVVIDVHDLGPDLGLAAPRRSAPDEIGGRGLQIVEAICTEWGVSPDGEGKSVWFALSLPTAGHGGGDLIEMSGHRSTEPEVADAEPDQQQGRARAAG